jgi:Flp pilus assembly pilin Flp
MLYLFSKYESLDLLAKFKSLKSDRRGVTALEYAVVAALVIGGVSLAFTGLGSAIATRINGIAATITPPA